MEASSAAEDDGAAADEDEDLLVSDGEEGEAALKNAQSKVIDVEFNGGWKEGTPYAFQGLARGFLTDLPSYNWSYIGYRMPRSRMYSPKSRRQPSV